MRTEEIWQLKVMDYYDEPEKIMMKRKKEKSERGYTVVEKAIEIREWSLMHSQDISGILSGPISIWFNHGFVEMKVPSTNSK